MKRVRLTARKLRAESKADYSNYDWQLGWDIPEPNAPKIKDERDENGLGIPKTADVYQTAKAAAVLAQMYLGDDAPDEAVEEQARDFMKLGHRRIVSSIRRWKATEPVPAVEEEKKEEIAPVMEAPVTTEACKASEEVEAPAAAEEPEACKANAEEIPAEEEKTAEGNCEIGFEENADDLAEVTANDAEEEAPELNIEIPEAQEAGPIFTGSEELNQVEPDPELQAMFEGEEIEPAEEVTAKKTAKQGLKHLGGQPKFASSDSFGVKELEGIWTNLKAPGL